MYFSISLMISPFLHVGGNFSAVLLHERQMASIFVVFDAKSMDEVGRVEFKGIQMHKDFYGIFHHLLKM